MTKKTKSVTKPNKVRWQIGISENLEKRLLDYEKINGPLNRSKLVEMLVSNFLDSKNT